MRARSAGAPPPNPRVSIRSKSSVRRAQWSSPAGGSASFAGTAAIASGGTAMPSELEIALSQRITACASTGRAAGSFAISARMSASSSTGASGACCRSRGGGSRMCFTSTLGASGASNGKSCVTISNMMIPSE